MGTERSGPLVFLGFLTSLQLPGADGGVPPGALGGGGGDLSERVVQSLSVIQQRGGDWECRLAVRPAACRIQVPDENKIKIKKGRPTRAPELRSSFGGAPHVHGAPLGLSFSCLPDPLQGPVSACQPELWAAI